MGSGEAHHIPPSSAQRADSSTLLCLIRPRSDKPDKTESFDNMLYFSKVRISNRLYSKLYYNN